MGLINPVAYQIYNGEVRLEPDKAYGYYMAGNGLFKVARTRHFNAILPLALTDVKGLPKLNHGIALRAGKLPGDFLSGILSDARARSRSAPREAMYHICVADSYARVFCPPQKASAARLDYTGGDDPAIICDLHSHQQMNAFWSNTDTQDELGCRFYAVIGKIFTQPEIRLRLGVYGDFWPVPVTTLFTHAGPFIDREKAR